MTSNQHFLTTACSEEGQPLLQLTNSRPDGGRATGHIPPPDWALPLEAHALARRQAFGQLNGMHDEPPPRNVVATGDNRCLLHSTPGPVLQH